VRKAMRLTKFIEHFKLAAVASDANTSDPVVKYLAVGRQLGYAFYMLLDNMTYPDVAGIKKFSAAARLQKEAYRAWCVGLTCNVVAGLYALYNLRLAAQKQDDSADAEKAMEVKKLAKYVYLRLSVPFSRNGLLTIAITGTRASRNFSSSPTCAT
jgi:peroxin-11B